MDLKFNHRTCLGQGRARRDEGRVESDETTVCTSNNRLGVGQSARRRGFRLESQVGMIRAAAQVSFGVSSREKEKEETYTANNHLPKTNKGTSEWAPAPSEVLTDFADTMR